MCCTDWSIDGVKNAVKKNDENTDQVDDKVDQVKGSIKEGVGKLTGDEKTEKEGTAEKVIAKVKEVAKDAKDAVEIGRAHV